MALKKKNPRAFDFLGNIAIVNFPKEFKSTGKKKFAEKLLKEQKSIKTVLEKQGKIKGRLRKISTKYLAGEKTKEVLYKEGGCVFRFNIDTTYFSPRLSNERKEIASKIKKGENVLVMFAGVAPFSIIIAKNSKAKKVVSNEINREANKYAKLNVELNKVKDKVEIVQGDIKRIAEQIKGGPLHFDVIVMPRPKLKDSFLEQAFMLSKKGTRIYYYDFCKIDETESIVEKIKKEANKFKKKIKILKVKKAGEIAPYKIRVRVDLQIV
jgi:tRNA (guanine37-N1)-methyltransferase